MFELLPTEIVIQILSVLPTEALIRFSRSARKWHQTVSHSSAFWSSVRIAENCESITNADALTLVCSFIPTSQLVDLDLSGCLLLTAEIVPLLLTDCPALVRLSLKGCQGIDLFDVFALLSYDKDIQPRLRHLALEELELSHTRLQNIIVSCENTSYNDFVRVLLMGLRNLLGAEAMIEPSNKYRNPLRFYIYPCGLCKERLAPYAPRSCGATPKDQANFLCESCAKTIFLTCAECEQVSLCRLCSEELLVPVTCSLAQNDSSGSPVKDTHHHSDPLHVCNPPCEGVKRHTCAVCGWYQCPSSRADLQTSEISDATCPKCQRGICKSCLASSSVCPCEAL